MAGVRLDNNGHKIEVQLNTLFTAVEIVRYEGREVSRKTSLLGTTHSFDAVEDGSPVKYEVKTRFTWHGAACTISRDGKVIFDYM